MLEAKNSKVNRRAYYVYVHKRKSDGRVFYVGKGFGYRAWSRHHRNDHWNKIAAKHGFNVEILERGYAEWYAHEREIQIIEKYGRDNLCNRTDGGEGCSNPSQSARERMGAANRGCKRSPEHIKALAAAHRGVPRSEDVRKRIGLAHKGVPKPSIQGGNHPLARAVRCVEINMEFPTLRAAVDWLRSIGHNKAQEGNISWCASGHVKSAYGFTWKEILNTGAIRC